jgi:membrane protein insertase Oxa1/YidC/SpoIIIJ
MAIVAASAIAQYYQSKQLLPDDKEKRSLRSILKDAGNGKQADSGEVNAAVGRSTRYLLPGMIFLITVNIASALSLYWLASGIVAIIQQGRVLKEDETEMEAVADKKDKKVIEGEMIPPKPGKRKKKTSSNKKRRK